MESFGRRNFLQLGGGLAVATLAGSALAGCGKGEDTGSVTNAGTTLAPFPTYVPFAGPPADLPADGKGVQNAYLNYPTKIVKSVADTPGDGSEVTAIIITYSPPPAGLASSPRWQAVNKALGVNLKVTVVPDAQFADKMATVMASGELPDLIMLGAGYTLPREQAFVASKCADLSGLISGDKIKDYPNLANIPGYAWSAIGRIGGKLYGLPTERPLPGNSLLVNRTRLNAVGAPARWSKEDFSSAMGKLTGSRRWGIGIAREALGGSGLAYHAGSMGAPNNWKLDGSTFISTYGTDEYKEALAFTSELWKKKTYYPDSPTTSQVDLETLMFNQTVSTITDGFGTYYAAVPVVKDAFDVDFALPYGSSATPWQGTGIFGYTVFKKAPEDRLKMLLRVCNYLAAPFGTEEYELINFGIEGKDFTRSGTDITLKEDGNPLPPPFRYIAAGPGVINIPGYPDATKRLYEWEKALIPMSIPDPSNGLRSATQTKSGAKLNTMLSDAAAQIMQGRAPVSGWDDVVAKWRSAGGDAIAAELAKEHDANK